MSHYRTCDIMPPDNKSMTNEITRAVVITGKYAVRSSPREERNIVAMETVGPLPLIFYPYILMAVLGMYLQVMFSNNNLQATITASHCSYSCGSAFTNTCLVGLSSGLSPSLTMRAMAQCGETKSTKLVSTFSQHKHYLEPARTHHDGQETTI